MATGGAGTAANTNPQPIPQASHRGAPAPNPPTESAALSPPSKRELASWWKKFRKTTEKTDEKGDPSRGIFNVPLAESIRYANVAISLTNEEGESFIYGYVPIVVAKCGVFLKEKATDVEGIFRLSGSAKRIKDLQTIFNSPDRYGKGLDWTGYTVHDAANILRRYLNQLPEPIVPLEFYEQFRDPLRSYQSRAMNDGEMQPIDMTIDQHRAAVESYQKLITLLPPLNRQLLLYILDLLAVFASKSDLNRMTAANLAAIFQPGIISHPTHDMSPIEYRLSQDVLIFLIENQDNFLIGMTGTAVDEQTQKDVESGPPSVPSPKNIGRSASNASAGADSLRKLGVRRNVSVSSGNSRERSSPGVSSPGTPSGTTQYPVGAGSPGVARSNTVPSKRSPAVGPSRFQRLGDTPDLSPPVFPPTIPVRDSSIPRHDGGDSNRSRTGSSDRSPVEKTANATEPMPPLPVQTQPLPQPQPQQQNEQRSPSTPAAAVPPPAPVSSGTRERKISNLFSRSPLFGPSDAQQRQGKKLQKRRIPGSANESAQSSQASLHAEEGAPYYTPLLSPELAAAGRTDPLANPALMNTSATPVHETPSHQGHPVAPGSAERQNHATGTGLGLQPPKSPAGSVHSRSSITDHSEIENTDEAVVRAEKIEKRRNRWRFSSSAKKPDDFVLVPPPPIGQNARARGSSSSVGSSSRPRQSFTAESHNTQEGSSLAQSTLVGQSSNESDLFKDGNTDAEKKGLFGKWKAKMAQSRDERKEREAEKERAKSPPRFSSEHGASRGSLSAIAQERISPRGQSFDKPRTSVAGPAAEEVLSTVTERPNSELFAQGLPPPQAGNPKRASVEGSGGPSHT